jgi:hypothetical protein
MAGATGCASSGLQSEGVTMAQGETAGLQAGEARVVGAHVNPMLPVRLSTEGGEIAVRFAHSRTSGAIVHIDRDSLGPTGLETPAPAEDPAPESGHAVRAALGAGRFIVCWKSGSAEQGYRVMAQAWSAGGDPLGAPVAISPADADVLGSPEMLPVDGDRALATFAAVQEDRTEVLAVELKVL